MTTKPENIDTSAERVQENPIAELMREAARQFDFHGSGPPSLVERLLDAAEEIERQEPVEQRPFDYADAYQGAREDLAIWKRRALEAERRVRKQDQIIDRMSDDLNAISGPTFMGEPVLLKRPAPDVAQLVEALSALRGCIMETRGPDAHSALVLADAALAAHRKQEGSHDNQ